MMRGQYFSNGNSEFNIVLYSKEEIYYGLRSRKSDG